MVLHETKELLCSKGNGQMSEGNLTEWEKFVVSYVSNNTLISRISKELKIKTSRKQISENGLLN